MVSQDERGSLKPWRCLAMVAAGGSWVVFLSYPALSKVLAAQQLTVSGFPVKQYFIKNTSFPGEIPGDGVERGHTR